MKSVGIGLALTLAACHADALDEACGGESCLVLRVLGSTGPLDQIGVTALEGFVLSARTPDPARDAFELPVLVPIAIRNFAGAFRVRVSGLRGSAMVAESETSGTLARGERKRVEVTLAHSDVDGAIPDASDGGAVEESDCLDGLDDDLDGLIDCADPGCADRVACVDPSDGGALGFFSDGGCAGELALVSGLVVPGDCAGCACEPIVACSFAISIANAQCMVPVGVASLTVRSNPAGVPDQNQCYDVFMTLDPATLLIERSFASLGCKVTNQPSPSPASWQFPARFCALADPRTCAGGGRCVRRIPGTPLCVRLVGTTACPAPFPSPRGIWHQPGEINDTRQCACTCPPSGNPRCEGLALLTTHPSPACQPASGNGRVEIHDAGVECKSPDAGTNYWGPFGSIQVVHSEWQGVTCDSQGILMGSATATGGALICCQ